MEHSPSEGANRSSASQEIPLILWDPKALATCPYPEPDQLKFSPCLPISTLENPFSVCLLSTPMSSKWPTSTPTSTRSRHTAAKTCAVCLHLQHSRLMRSTVTTLRAGQSRKPASISGRDKRFFSFQNNSYQLWGHLDPHSINARCTFPLDKADGA
jgi:hypothetical protein